MIRQPYALGIPARFLGLAKYHEILVNASADISLSASIRLGSNASAVLPNISATTNAVFRNITASADIGLLSLGGVRLGSKSSAIIAIGATVSTSKQSIVTASAILPLISMGNKITAAARIPLISAAPIVSLVNTTTSVTWVSNLSLEETTKFTNFGFINLVRIGNTVYGIKSDGLYALGATTDNNTTISSYIKTHPQSYKQMLYKRIPYMYVQTAYPIAVTSYIDSVTEGPRTTDHGQQKVTMSKGTQGYYWSYKIANVAPNSFKIDGIEPFIDFLKRRA